jgi:hypothetical protein
LTKILYQSGDGVDCLRVLVRDAKPLRALREEDKKQLEHLVMQHLKPDSKAIPADEQGIYKAAYHTILQKLRSDERLGTKAIKNGLAELRYGMLTATTSTIPTHYDPKPLVDLFLIAMYNYETLHYKK